MSLDEVIRCLGVNFLLTGYFVCAMLASIAIDISKIKKFIEKMGRDKQEAVKPIPLTDDSDLWKCGNCGHQLFMCTHQRYCEMCGRKVKWE